MKMSKKILIISLSLIMFLSISAISATDSNADIASNMNQDDEGLQSVEVDDNVLADSGNSNIIASSNENVLGDANTISLTDLENKIKSTGSTLVLDSDVAYDSKVDDIGGIIVAKDLVINGNGHTIDGKGKTRIFWVATGQTLTLKNINFVNGYMAGNMGGGVILNSGALKVTNCNFTSCKVEGSGASGGAIGGAGKGTFSNCNFKKCSATSFGGAAYVNKNKFVNCNFYSNVAANGGAIGGTVYLYSCYFKDCKATASVSPKHDDNGGGACNGEISHAESSVFINCNAPKSYGGALRGTTEAVNCQFTDCSAKQGGAIRGTLKATGCTFKHCVALSDMGGAIFSGKETIEKCKFIDCSASKSNGGAVFLGSYANVIACKFINCSAPNGYGGAVYGAGLVKKCTFERNSAKYGGAVGSYSLTVKGSTFTANTATRGGAACNVYKLVSCTFNNNKATYGGALCNALNVVSSTFGNNYAKFGALSYNDANVVFNKITVKSSVNLVQGLFHNYKRYLTLTGSTIINTGKFNKFFNYNTGIFMYKNNKLKSSVKIKVVAGPRGVKTK